MIRKINNLSFLFVCFLYPLGIYLKYHHAPGAEPLLITVLLITVLSVVGLVGEVRAAPYLSARERKRWQMAFFLFSGVAALLYFLKFRKLRFNATVYE